MPSQTRRSRVPRLKARRSPQNSAIKVRVSTRVRITASRTPVSALGQQLNSEQGTRKAGVASRVELNEQFDFVGEVFTQENIVTDVTRDASLGGTELSGWESLGDIGLYQRHR